MAELQYALKNGNLVHIDDVDNGLKCGCLCPNCQSPLVAANHGKVKEHHFRHYRAEDCGGGCESALHLMGKNVIAQLKQLYVPGDADGFEGGIKTYQQAELEYVILPDVRADVMLENNDEKLLVEILVTHEVDETKQEKLIKLGVPAVEIDLSDFLNKPYTAQDIQTAIEEGISTRWLSNAYLLRRYMQSRMCDHLPLINEYCTCPEWQEPRHMLNGKHSCHECWEFVHRYPGDDFWKVRPCSYRFKELGYEVLNEVLEEKRENGIVTYMRIRADGKEYVLTGQPNELLSADPPMQKPKAKNKNSEKKNTGSTGLPAKDCKSVIGLWKDHYQYMVIRRYNEKRDILICGRDGKIIAKQGCIVARDVYYQDGWKYKNNKSDYYLLTQGDAESEIWLLQFCESRFQQRRKRTAPYYGYKSFNDCRTLRDIVAESRENSLCVINTRTGYKYSLIVKDGKIIQASRDGTDGSVYSLEISPIFGSRIWIQGE